MRARSAPYHILIIHNWPLNSIYPLNCNWQWYNSSPEAGSFMLGHRHSYFCSCQTMPNESWTKTRNAALALLDTITFLIISIIIIMQILVQLRRSVIPKWISKSERRSRGGSFKWFTPLRLHLCCSIFTPIKHGPNSLWWFYGPKSW